MDVVIRPERQSDLAPIGEVTRQAFASHPHGSRTEQFIVDALRAADALAVSLVAERAGQVAGHIAFSAAVISDGSPGWYVLGPVSVRPPLQNRGIGRQLVECGLARLRALGACGCVLVGEPSFYGRFGFGRPASLVLPGVPQEYVLALPFGPVCACGEVALHPAFSAQG